MWEPKIGANTTKDLMTNKTSEKTTKKKKEGNYSHGKKYFDVNKKVDKNKSYSISEACSLIKSLVITKFDASVDCHLKLNFDTTKDAVRGTVVFPHGTGKKKKIIVFADDKTADDAKKAGAVDAGNKDLIEKISKGWLDFDIAIAHPTMMAEVGKLGKVLGTKGLMPNPKAGTVTPDIIKAVNEFSKGKEQFKADSYGIVHCSIGKASFAPEQLKDNLLILIEGIKKAKPAKTKGQFFVSLHIAPTMSPSIKIGLDEVR